ncbi:hypothetical protein YQE_09277, partial [Dendroctonus ponderosae]
MDLRKALDKLGLRHLFNISAPEPVHVNVAFDVASLILYGCQALPIRLKILLDRLFSVLQKDEVIQVLHGFGWTSDDYARGYILQIISSTITTDNAFCVFSINQLQLSNNYRPKRNFWLSLSQVL